MENKIISKINYSNKIYLFLLALYPVAIIFGNLFINLFIAFISLSFLVNLKSNKIFLKNNLFYLFVFLFISLMVNIIFSTNISNSVPRVLKIFFIIFFVFHIIKLIQLYSLNYIKYVYLFWSITFFILTLDIIFEIIFGHNMMGNVSSMSGRIASFFGDELVAGAFYHGFILIFLSYLTYKKVKPPILLSIIISLLIISFLIGERSNFIKIFLSIIIFTAIVVKIDMRLKILSLIFTLLSFLLLTNLNDSYKTRYLDQLKTLFSVNGYKNYLMESQYGAHRDAAFKIFKENKFFGVGIKNFRNEVGKEKFKNENYLKTETRISTHPHQIHYEILSETGIFGYFCFSVFFILSIFYSIKNCLKTKNLYQLSGIIFVIISLLPILPTGSFLSTFTSSIFWLNFAIMCGYNNFKS